MGARTPDYWYGERSPPLWTRWLAALYAQVVALRIRLYARGWLKSVQVAAPVLVVGNVSVGGTGKTPLTIALVQRLQQAGYTPGVASRGYGRNNANQAAWVDKDTPAELGGDEPVLIAQRTGVPVRVDADRVAAAQALVAKGCDVIVCDDGLQHYRLRRDLEIEVIDGARRYGNGRMLPAGPLREPAGRGAHCGFRVVNLNIAAAEDDRRTGFGEWPMRLQASEAVPLRGGRAVPLAHFGGHRVHAVAGIGHPQRFFDALRGHGIGVVPHAFDDHHAYVARDLSFGSELPILMTEKDAVKCAAFANDWCYAVPVGAALPEAFWAALLEKLAQTTKRSNESAA